VLPVHATHDHTVLPPELDPDTLDRWQHEVRPGLCCRREQRPDEQDDPALATINESKGWERYEVYPSTMNSSVLKTVSSAWVRTMTSMVCISSRWRRMSSLPLQSIPAAFQVIVRNPSFSPPAFSEHARDDLACFLGPPH
jgi:hypothetical protein